MDDRPVDLAVHSMPQAHELAQQPARIRSGRIKMLLVLALLPLLLLWPFTTLRITLAAALALILLDGGGSHLT